ncbi:MAG TPA: TerC family protein [Pyrinomonadaceae bacterium]|jgi:tellurite resistance protein TerC
MGTTVWLWVGFTLFILLMLAVDLGLFNRKAHVVTYRQAIGWSAVWIALALLFSGVVYWRYSELAGGGRAAGLDAVVTYLTGYIIELSLSVDNLFVFLLIFAYFKVPAKYQHRVLYWGILGALVMRGVMIGAGAYLIQRFHFVIYVFGAFLVYTGIQMFRQDEEDANPEQGRIVHFVTRFVPITRHYEGKHFFTRAGGRPMGTLLLLVLITVEVSDLIFAVDSIPAIFAVTTNPFIVYTSNVFAILGLRSFYFLLAGVIEKFHYLKTGLAAVLTFIGLKMLAEIVHVKLPPVAALAVVAAVLLASVAASLIWPAKEQIEVQLPEGFNSPHDDDQGRLGAEEPTIEVGMRDEG